MLNNLYPVPIYKYNEFRQMQRTSD